MIGWKLDHYSKGDSWATRKTNVKVLDVQSINRINIRVFIS